MMDAPRWLSLLSDSFFLDGHITIQTSAGRARIQFPCRSVGVNGGEGGSALILLAADTTLPCAWMSAIRGLAHSPWCPHTSRCHPA